MVPKVVIFDIDGTLADNEHRAHFLKPPLYEKKFGVTQMLCVHCEAEPGNSHKDDCFYIQGWKKDWDAFFNPEEQIKDAVIQPVYEVYAALKAVGHSISFLTGRPEKYREVTQAWLQKHHLYYHPLLMRPNDDRTDDDLLKIRMVEDHYGLRNILCVFEDRLRIVKAWRNAGVFCYHVGGGDF